MFCCFKVCVVFELVVVVIYISYDVNYTFVSVCIFIELGKTLRVAFWVVAAMF